VDAATALDDTHKRTLLWLWWRLLVWLWHLVTRGA
jgi:hypothetical protein